MFRDFLLNYNHILGSQLGAGSVETEGNKPSTTTVKLQPDSGAFWVLSGRGRFSASEKKPSEFK
jgi:hypothetical protein